MPSKKNKKTKGAASKSSKNRKKNKKQQQQQDIQKVENLVEKQPFSPPVIERWVKLHLKLIDWSFMDIQEYFSSSLPVHRLKRIIRKRHGRIQNIVLCKDEFKESNELSNDKKSLQDYGMEGGLMKDESAPCYTIFYNFQPQDNDDPDPILLAWMD